MHFDTKCKPYYLVDIKRNKKNLLAHEGNSQIQFLRFQAAFFNCPSKPFNKPTGPCQRCFPNCAICFKVMNAQ